MTHLTCCYTLVTLFFASWAGLGLGDETSVTPDPSRGVRELSQIRTGSAATSHVLPVNQASRPVIRKLGAIDCDLVETTPFVFKDKLYRLEWVRSQYKGNKQKRNYLHILDLASGEEVSAFGEDHMFASAYAEGDTVYVLGTDASNQSIVDLFTSHDLRHWISQRALDDPKYNIYNTSLCKAGDHYVLMFEIDKPAAECGVPFTARFATSRDLRQWTVTPPECAYALDRYTAPHCLRYLDGYYYNFYLESLPDGSYEQRIVRSQDLAHWEASPFNPVLRASATDKQISSPKIDAAEAAHIREARDINNSDIDFCEYRGKLYINYSWGNQTGTEFLAEAIYDGTLADFLRGWFPPAGTVTPKQ